MSKDYKHIQTKEDYTKLLNSGMFWEFHPELSGNWQDDEMVIKNINYDTVLATVLPKWDCDDCKHYPCTHHDITNKDNKLRYNQCGDHSKRGTP